MNLETLVHDIATHNKPINLGEGIVGILLDPENPKNNFIQFTDLIGVSLEEASEMWNDLLNIGTIRQLPDGKWIINIF
jgi:hypothetical protein